MARVASTPAQIKYRGDPPNRVIPRDRTIKPK
jgi:hypothetical protein